MRRIYRWTIGNLLDCITVVLWPPLMMAGLVVMLLLSPLIRMSRHYRGL